MYLASSLSDQQNFALWAIVSFLVVFPTTLLFVAILGAAQRNRTPNA